MVEQTHVVQRASKARGLDVHSTATARNQPAQTYPLQLTLFQTFFSEKNPSEDATTAESYSNTIELYDAIPKYVLLTRFGVFELNSLIFLGIKMALAL